MKLKIVEKFWSVDSPTRTTGVLKVPLALGPVPSVGRGGMRFTVDAISEEGVQLTVHYQNEAYNKTWTLTREKGVYYRPMSMDGGHEYFIDLKRW